MARRVPSWSGELDVVQFGVSGAAREVGRALGQADHVVSGAQVDGGADGGAELAPAGGRRVADRAPGAAVVGQALGGGGAGAVGVADGHGVGAGLGHVDDEVDVAVGARGAGVVDAADVSARRRAGGGQPQGAEDGGVLGFVALLVGGHTRGRFDDELVGAGGGHVRYGDAEPAARDGAGGGGDGGGGGHGGEAAPGGGGQEGDADAGAERLQPGQLDGVGARLVAEDHVDDPAGGVVRGEPVEARLPAGRRGDHVAR